jgi:HlyD family secretion protein
MSTSEKTATQPGGGESPDVRKERLGKARPNARLIKVGAVAALVLVVAGGLTYALTSRNGSKAADTGNAVPVVRGNLTVTVTEGGAMVAVKSLELKSEVEGRKSILELVDEGTVVTQEDVDKGLVLCKLDSADLEESLSSRAISFSNTEAQYTKAQEDYAIQLKQNESDISKAELDVKFAGMELELYLGAELAAQVLQKREDFANLGEDLRLGGAALQSLRDFQSKVQLADETLQRDTDTLKWTETLYARGFESGTKLTADRLALSSSKVQKTASEENLRLFKRYTLPKDAEQRYSDYVEATRALERVKAQCHSKILTAETKVKSTQASYELEKKRLEKTRLMVDKCTIRAPKPGRVVYASSTDPWARHRNPIQKGSQVYQTQTLFTIPDMTTLAARVNIHETDVEQVKLGQRAMISVEALPGKSFAGKVTRVSPVASSANAWLNPEIKVYETDVAVEGTPEGLTPGMSATAQIVVAELTDVLYVPITAITTYQGERVCLVRGSSGPEVRPVETGRFTEKFVEIKNGLREREAVYVDPVQQLGERFWELTPEPSQSGLQMIQERAGQANGQKPADAPAEAKTPDDKAPEQAQSQSIDWRKYGEEIRNATTDEERQKITQEFVAKLSPDQRKQFEERMRARQNMSPQDSERPRPQSGGGGGTRQETRGQ